ncbi:hypothetical protein B0T21DRAFT_71457 [Apiosordaria backusii]|uniref:Uncharacterized protein n=1 Tax=Apiosordaria backusii TaxID=314023 RepID=A0AA40AEK6_9PEZI|nr:hypothetical protein B0T21DRAFT_71457 [Apiosordaria backusii]
MELKETVCIPACGAPDTTAPAACWNEMEEPMGFRAGTGNFKARTQCRGLGSPSWAVFSGQLGVALALWMVWIADSEISTSGKSAAQCRGPRREGSSPRYGGTTYTSIRAPTEGCGLWLCNGEPVQRERCAKSHKFSCDGVGDAMQETETEKEYKKVVLSLHRFGPVGDCVFSSGRTCEQAEVFCGKDQAAQGSENQAPTFSRMGRLKRYSSCKSFVVEPSPAIVGTRKFWTISMLCLHAPVPCCRSPLSFADKIRRFC